MKWKILAIVDQNNTNLFHYHTGRGLNQRNPNQLLGGLLISSDSLAELDVTPRLIHDYLVAPSTKQTPFPSPVRCQLFLSGRVACEISVPDVFL